MKTSVSIVSVYGRSIWLASELSRKGFDVTLVDVTASLGRWSPEDREGPFGYFSSEYITSTQEERITAEDYIDPVTDGLVLWTDEGPRDFKGAISRHWLKQVDPLGFQRDYITQFHKLNSSKKKEMQKDLNSMSFEETWISLLSHQLASTEYADNINSFNSSCPLDFFNSYYVKRTSRRSVHKIFDWCETQGIKVIRGHKIGDLAFEQGKLKVIEIENSDVGTLTSDYYVWALSSSETQFSFKKAYESIFENKINQSQWYWTRYRTEISNEQIFETLPKKFLIIEDKDLSWTHENLLLLQKTETGKQIDVWLRIPTEHRFHLDYLKEIENKVVNILTNKLPSTEIKITEHPQEYNYSYSQLGPEVFPVYEEGFKSIGSSIKNVFLDGPEHWVQFSTFGRFSNQTQILKNIVTLKEKAERKTVDTEVHAP